MGMDWQSGPAVAALRERFPDAVLAETTFRGETTLEIAREQIVPVCQFLKEDLSLRFNFLTDLCGADYPERGERFDVVYHLYSFPNNVRLRLKVHTDDVHPVPSVTAVWAAANWMEREAYDLYGIQFNGHPNLERILMPEDWVGYPLRKDYSIYAEEVDQAHMSSAERHQARGGPIFAEEHFDQPSHVISKGAHR